MKGVESFAADLQGIASANTEPKTPGYTSQAEKSGHVENSPSDEPQQKGEFFDNEKTIKENSPSENVTDAAIKASGITGVYLVDMLAQLVGGTALTIKTHLSSTKAEKQRYIQIDGFKQEDLVKDDKELYNKFQAILKKHEKTNAKMPLNDDEKKVIQHAFEEHTRATGKSLSPNLILIVGIAEIVSSRAIEIIF